MPVLKNQIRTTMEKTQKQQTKTNKTERKRMTASTEKLIHDLRDEHVLKDRKIKVLEAENDRMFDELGKSKECNAEKRLCENRLEELASENQQLKEELQDIKKNEMKVFNAQQTVDRLITRFKKHADDYRSQLKQLEEKLFETDMTGTMLEQKIRELRQDKEEYAEQVNAMAENVLPTMDFSLNKTFLIDKINGLGVEGRLLERETTYMSAPRDWCLQSAENIGADLQRFRDEIAELYLDDYMSEDVNSLTNELKELKDVITRIGMFQWRLKETLDGVHRQMEYLVEVLNAMPEGDCFDISDFTDEEDDDDEPQHGEVEPSSGANETDYDLSEPYYGIDEQYHFANVPYYNANEADYDANENCYGVKEPNYDVKQPNYGFEEHNHDVNEPDSDADADCGATEPNYDVNEPSYDVKEQDYGVEKGIYYVSEPVSYANEENYNIIGTNYDVGGSEPDYDVEEPNYFVNQPNYFVNQPDLCADSDPDANEQIYDVKQPNDGVEEHNHGESEQDSYASEENYDVKEPNYGAKVQHHYESEPNYDANEEIYDLVEPDYGVKDPDYDDGREPVYFVKEPNDDVIEENYDVKEPNDDISEPEYGVKVPNDDISEPECGVKDPSCYGRELVYFVNEPNNDAIEPDYDLKEPIYYGSEPWDGSNKTNYDGSEANYEASEPYYVSESLSDQADHDTAEPAGCDIEPDLCAKEPQDAEFDPDESFRGRRSTV